MWFVLLFIINDENKDELFSYPDVYQSDKEQQYLK